jgi:dipeptidyl aminopeptidase/acylaminoacyl peptidase
VAAARVAPFGSWASPITAELIADSAIGFGDIQIDAAGTGGLYWRETRPREQGRSVIVRAAGGATAELTPAGFNVNTRVHEYGGGAYLVADGTVYFCNDSDQRLYRQEPGQAPVAVTEPPHRPRGLRYADGVVDHGRGRMIWVREDHTTDAAEPQNTLVDLAIDGSREQRVLAAGADFYAAPRLSPDGNALAWLEWRHPNMPWDGTELWLGRIAADGSIGDRRRVAGGPEEAVQQPRWSPDGILYFVSDRSGWWNLYRLGAGGPEALYPLEAEFGGPPWQFRPSSYAFLAADSLACAYSKDGRAALARVDVKSLAVSPIATDFTAFGSLQARDGKLYFTGGSPRHFPAVVEFDPGTGEARQLARAAANDPQDFAGYLSMPQPVAFPTADGMTAFALFYAPANRDFAAPDGELPPLILRCHGGPTGAASATLDWGVQFWTSRGFAVADVNYGGSTGYGRAYRERLRGKWGVVDVEDCVNAARHLAATGRVDGRHMAIRGGSAGGYTTLCALTFHDVFAAGASHYGIGDLEALARDTHKFESRYMDGLIGPYPEARDLYRARSPIHFTDRLAVPVALFQGADDPIVPPNQAEAMAAALQQKRLPVLYLSFEGERHGFRRADTVRRALDAELCFYSLYLSKARLAFTAGAAPVPRS